LQCYSVAGAPANGAGNTTGSAHGVKDAAVHGCTFVDHDPDGAQAAQVAHADTIRDELHGTDETGGAVLMVRLLCTRLLDDNCHQALQVLVCELHALSHVSPFYQLHARNLHRLSTENTWKYNNDRVGACDTLCGKQPGTEDVHCA
jgi:hypothetical protein